MLTPIAFVLMDMLLYEAMDLVRRHARIEYTQTGKHDLTLRVLGTGFLARIVRSVLRSFTFRQRLRSVRSNTVCLPQPHRLQRYYYYKIFGSYLAIWLLIFVGSYTQRLQRAICAYFYPKREKKRVLFLYNETLKRRIGMARHLKAAVRRKAREHRLQVEASFLAALRVRCPRWCCWLRVFRSARRKCLVCSETEPCSRQRGRRLFMDCPTATCHAFYCKVCWGESGEICYVCSFEDDSDTDDDTGVEGSDASDSD
ncbi:hypothetical protein R5R35_006509 [Gryllus longicercus]|uniref:Dendritic cell-specific transmembrane protein-like domain-containing protein n=1 Tax=Gryllus longicercus TaxID=2509291 RepID=A0AAN9VKT4_9ORTH